MADRFLTNYAPAQTHAWWAIWKLGTELMAAGYELKACGDGVSFAGSSVGSITPGSGTDYWTSLNPVGGAAAPSAWCCLRNPTLGFEIVLWRQTTDNWNGKIIIAKSTDQFALSAGMTATNPGTIPATAGYLRGSGAAWAAWMGGAGQTIGVLQIGVKDVAGSDGGSFFIFGSSPAYSANTWAHSLKCAILDPYCTTQGVDPEPYAFQCATSATGSYGSYDFAPEWQTDSATGTSGPWWGYRADGAWSQFGSGSISVYATAGSIINTIALDRYSAGTKYFLDRILIIKEETAHQERKGWTRSFRYSMTTHAQYSTFSALTFAKFASGNQSIVFWDGATASPHG